MSPRATLAAASLALLAGCYEVPGGGSGGLDPMEAPPPGEPADVGYPSGPFGVSVGSVIENYAFDGFPDSTLDNATLAPIHLGDFYNPTGDGVFPGDSPYGPGEAKPRALLVTVSAVWCGPCNYEADHLLPQRYEQYQPLGGEFLLQLIDGPTPGVPAEPKHLTGWTKKYPVAYPAAIDPSYDLATLFTGGTSAFPANAIIDTRTMRLVEAIQGSPTDAFWAKFEETLAAE